jgi:hypothetical protein
MDSSKHSVQQQQQRQKDVLLYRKPSTKKKINLIPHPKRKENNNPFPPSIREAYPEELSI